MCFAAPLVRHDLQFKRRDIQKSNVIVFHLSGGTLWARIPLLSHDVSVRCTAVRRPAKDEFLSPLSLALFNNQQNPVETLRPIENKPNSLFARLCGSPAPCGTRR